MSTRRSHLLIHTAAAAVVAFGGLTVLAPTAQADPPPVKQDRRASASAEAMRTGKPVEVTSMTDEFSQTFANPDGSTYRLDMSVVPVRVRTADGGWTPVDTTLGRAGHGRIAPKASPAGVSFSDGGSGKGAIELKRHGNRVSLSWPGNLPTPTLGGDTATYTDVLPDVDLLLTATTDGYREVLRVRTREAADNPALEDLEFAVDSTDLRVVPNRRGSFDLVDGDGHKEFVSPAPVMWDSAGDGAPSRATAPAPPTSDAVGGEPPDEPQYEAPSAGDDVRTMPIETGRGHIKVKPDQKLLHDAATTYPVYIDPSVSLSLAERLMVGSNGEHDYNFSGDEGLGRCDASCPRTAGPYIKRMYFEFSNAKLSGKHVLNATFRAYEMWSYSCTPSWVRISRAASDISSSTRWPGPDGVDLLGDRYVSAGRGTACSPSQPDSWIEFNDNPSETDENLTSTVSHFADGSYGGHMTILMKASDETIANSWKRFRNDATLSVQYMWKPGVPGYVGVRTTSDPASRRCATDSGSPTVVAFPKPTMAATVYTASKPASGDDPGQLRAEYRLDHKKSDGTWETLWTGKEVPDASYKPNATATTTSTTSDLAEANLYRIKVRTLSHGVITETGKDVNLYSAYNKDWCYFLIDTTGAKAPTVTSSDLPVCDANSCPASLQPGLAGHFHLATSETNVEKFQYRLDNGTVTSTGTLTATSSGVSKDVTVTLPTDGVHLFQAWAVEAVTHKPSAKVTGYSFKVAPAPPEVGTWRVTESPGATVVADSSPGAVRHNLTLDMGAAVDAKGRRENAVDAGLNAVTDSSIRFTGAASSTAATAGSVVDTSGSFTVSAWAMLEDDSHNGTVVAQAADDARSAGYAIRWDAAARAWEFVWHWKDAAAGSPTTKVATQDVAGEPTRVWTHLTGVYDADADTLQLFVNGRPQTPLAGVVTEAAAGPMTLATTHYVQGTAADPFTGLVDEVRVSSRALTSDEVVTLAREVLDWDGGAALALAGAWVPDETVAGATAVADRSPYARPSMALAGNAVIDATGALALDGDGDSASSAGPVVDETGSFTVSSQVALTKAQIDAAPIGYRARVLGQRNGATGTGSSWALWYEKTAADAGQWKFGRWSSDGSQTVVTADYLPAQLDASVNVTGVYDASDDTLHLFIGDEERDYAAMGFRSQGGGELSIGTARQGAGWSDYLPGKVLGAKVWSGAMTADQVLHEVVEQS